MFEFGESGHERAEIVSFRLGAAAPSGAVPSLADGSEGAGRDGTASRERALTILDRGKDTVCRLLTRRAFPEALVVEGPVLVDDVTATIYIPPGWSAERDRHDNLVLRHRRTAA